ncbi:MAG TPA: nucleotidyltransferase family protein, partial [Myxococcales bacterium]|nr:nucleotidyltransferase family protein [Myxococcales bacterium]
VDLLVRGKDAPDAAARLQALGYRCYYWGHPFFHRAYYYEWPLAGPDLEIDLHRAFTQAARVAADYGALFERSLPWPSLAPNARLLAPEDALIAQALQPARNELSPSGCPAIGLLDLKLMIEREGPFWGSAGGPALDLSGVARRAEAWGAGAFVYAGLGYAVRLFPSLAARAAAAQPALPRWLSREIDRWIIDRAFPPPLADPRWRDVWLRKALVTSPGALARLAAQRAAGLATVFRRRLFEPRPRLERSVTPLGKRLFG